AAGQTKAQQFASQQTFTNTAPPAPGFVLADILDQVTPNGIYAGTAPNFPVPGPALPPDVTSIRAGCSSGARVVSSSPRCVTRWTSCYVRLTFDDGSVYVYEHTRTLTRCSNGVIVYVEDARQEADAGPPGSPSDVQVEWRYRDALLQRRFGRRVITPAASTLSYAASPVRPALAADDLEFLGGPGSTLDLRQNPAAGGPLFVSDAPAVLRCDTILLDPGVTIADLFQPPPIVLPGVLEARAELAVPAFRSLDALPTTLSVQLQNTGNQAAMFNCQWSDPMGFAAPGSQSMMLAAGQNGTFDIQLFVPPGTPRGTFSPLLVQVSVPSNPAASEQERCQLVFDHAGVLRFGDGTPGCLGAHTLDVDGPVVAGGAPTTFSCDAVQPGAIGLWLFGNPIGNYAGLTVPALGIELLVDPFGSLFVTQLAVAAPVGRFFTSVQWPYSLSLRGLDLTTQAVSLGDAGCVLQVFPMTSSPAIQFVIQ
ncbi:MAG TPA: hypothetical protein VFZ65_13025, partial [Planctomycetota bacterium]|nr:hypothetical protein [Planctomycetota bacterium]